MATDVKCQSFDFKKIFYADYTTGSRWDNRQGNLEISWSARATIINDEDSARTFSEKEIAWIRTAIKSWDDALSTVSFREVDATQSPAIVIGFVALKPSAVQLDAMAFWSAWVENGIRHRATIKLKTSESKWFSVKSQFTHTVQHELGNVLGLGDLAPSSSLTSVLEDPWQPPYGKPALSSIDAAMIRQLYGESSCSTNLATKL